jgi:hypothetical protein
MRSMTVVLLLLAALACGDTTKPVTSIDPYALFYVRNDKPTSPIYYGFIRFPNRTPVEESFIGSAGAGEEACASFGLESIIPGDPENMVQLVFKVTQDNRDPAANPPGIVIDSLMSPTVDPFALGANTPTTPHRFRLWWKADGSTFFDFGLWNDSTRWAAEPGWPCPTRF